MGIFPIGACDLCLYHHYITLNVSEYMSSTLNAFKSTLLLLWMCPSTHHSSPFWQEERSIVAGTRPSTYRSTA